MGKIIGIDLGTTYTIVSILRDTFTEVITDS